jgi:putative aldouronate transport system permease protein
MRKSGSSRLTREDHVFNFINVFALAVIGLIMLYPFYYTVICSFNDGIDLMRGGVYLWPRKLSLASYALFLTDNAWQSAFLMSVARTLVGALLSVMMTSMFAYGLSRPNLIFRKGYTMMVVITMYFSGGLIPYYILLRNLGLLNTFWVYVIPGMVNTFFTLTGINFMRAIPDSMLEAARIDGAKEMRIFTQIVLPTSLPFLATLSLFAAVGQWNSWLDSAYYVRDQYLYTLAYKMMTTINKALASSNNSAAAGQISTANTTTSFTIQATAMVIAMIPILCVYPFLQKYFVQGMMLGAVKE